MFDMEIPVLVDDDCNITLDCACKVAAVVAQHLGTVDLEAAVCFFAQYRDDVVALVRDGTGSVVAAWLRVTNEWWKRYPDTELPSLELKLANPLLRLERELDGGMTQ
jgi:hypothetical protein